MLPRYALAESGPAFVHCSQCECVAAVGAAASTRSLVRGRAADRRGPHAGHRKLGVPGGRRGDLTGTTVIPALIDGHNHGGLVNEKDGSNTKANYTRENLVDQLQRYAYYGTAAAMSMGLEANQDVAYALRDSVIPNAATFLTVGRGIAATSMAGPTGEARLGIPYGAATPDEGRQRVR